MAKKRETKADQARKWIKKHPGGSNMDFYEMTGIEMHSSQFSAVKRKMIENHEPAEDVSYPTTSEDRFKETVDALEFRVRYLEWARQGEREGYVDILISEKRGR